MLASDEAEHHEHHEHHETPRPAPAHAPAPGTPASTAPAGERGPGFSLFNWLRREPGPEDKKD